MKRRSIVLARFILFTSIIILLACEKDVPRMPKDELKAMLGSPNVVILDVRLESEWKKSDSKIEGAVREEPDDIESWVHKYSKENILVFYCN